MGDYLRPLGVRTVLVGKTHMARRHGRHAAARHRPGLDHRRARLRMRLRSLRARRRPARHGPDGATTAVPRYNDYLNDKGYARRQSLARLGQLGARARATARRPAGPMRARAQARAREGGAFRDALHDAPRHGLHRAKPATRPWCLHLSYIKPHWPYIAPAPYNDMYGAGTHPGRALGGRARRTRIRCSPRSWTCASRNIRARRGARRGDPGLHGPDQADRRPDGRAVRASCEERG